MPALLAASCCFLASVPAAKYASIPACCSALMRSTVKPDAARPAVTLSNDPTRITRVIIAAVSVPTVLESTSPTPCRTFELARNASASSLRPSFSNCRAWFSSLIICERSSYCERMISSLRCCSSADLPVIADIFTRFSAYAVDCSLSWRISIVCNLYAWPDIP